MNCKALARIMPELVAGELDDKKAAEAREHIAACAACADEFRRFEGALGALSARHEMVEVPEALDVLRLPEKVRRPWLRPALASFGAAMLLLAAILTLPLFYAEKPKTRAHTIVEQIPPKPQIIVKTIVPPQRTMAYHPVRRHRATVHRRRYVTKKLEVIELSEPPVIVIVSQLRLSPESYIVQIESTDTQSGESIVYSTVHDAEGDQTIGITSSTGDDRGI